MSFELLSGPMLGCERLNQVKGGGVLMEGLEVGCCDIATFTRFTGIQ